MTEPQTMSYSVDQVADIAGVTVRTLHHYDEIGLLSPSERNTAGYRRYTSTDTERLSQIRYYRELGFALDQITTILDDPHSDAMAHLRRQHELLRQRIMRLQDMVTAIERAMEAKKMGISLTPEEQFEVFGDVFFTEDGLAGVDVSDSDSYREAMGKIATYSKQDWQQIQADERELLGRLAEVMHRGDAADSDAATGLAEEHRRYVARYFTEGSPDGHRQLCEMYVDTPKYRATIEAVAPGLTEYLRGPRQCRRWPGLTIECCANLRPALTDSHWPLCTL